MGVGGDEENVPLFTDRTYEVGTSVSIDVTFDAQSKVHYLNLALQLAHHSDSQALTIFVNGVSQGSAVREIEMPEKGSLREAQQRPNRPSARLVRIELLPELPESASPNHPMSDSSGQLLSTTTSL